MTSESVFFFKFPVQDKPEFFQDHDAKLAKYNQFANIHPPFKSQFKLASADSRKLELLVDSDSPV
jgi:hypothetical protein